ncbi:DUF5994 family protein [Nonomuraea sp. NPDC050328]|uniref:DUF5994 family protein n=1 Tax=Nonomuraea sp. NPDC050328 TaxID=3364361 RepID=UPI0037AA29CB
MTPSQTASHPIAPLPAQSPATAPAVRLSLGSPFDSRRPVDGAWWPRSTAAATELVALIRAIESVPARDKPRSG